ncbi:MAG: primosomal protein N' [Burkholderiaceae bacterium]
MQPTSERVDTRPGARADGFAQVALDVPIAPWFDYRVPASLAGVIGAGNWVVVPWGRQRRVGLVIALAATSTLSEDKLRDVSALISDAPASPPSWLALARFAAGYYHRHLGEVLLPAVPKLLRTPPSPRARGSAFERARHRVDALIAPAASSPPAPAPAPAPPLTSAQATVLRELEAADGFRVHLLHGVTGSGKTEVYLRWINGLLAVDPNAQVLMLVPEIALTPQLAQRVRARFADEPVAVLHSGLAEGERAAWWLAAAERRARIVIGTRLAVLTPMPGLAGIVVDEEHDPSFKQQEGVHYSARDLAVMAGQLNDVPVLLGSATPSAETWLAARRGRYAMLSLPHRASGVEPPRLHLVPLHQRAPDHGLSEPALTAARETLARGEQVLVFLNRRGFAPVLACASCGWLSRCEHCAAYRVLHRVDPLAELLRRAARGDQASSRRPTRYRLICHHCAAEQAVPRACPECGSIDLGPLGRGTQRLEEALVAAFPEARVARLDRDVARRRGAAQQVLDAVHAGEVDLLVGTQMLAKGHDFQRLALVVVVDADSGLYAADFRAPERLFATLTQVAGRAGRAMAGARVIVQTRYPDHPLFASLLAHDFPGFADRLLDERQEAGLPPFRHQALLRAEAVTIEDAIGFLAQAHAVFPADAPSQVQCFDPVPMPLARVAGKSRAQLLVESTARPALHRVLDAWLEALDAIPSRARWQLEVDPIEI